MKRCRRTLALGASLAFVLLGSRFVGAAAPAGRYSVSNGTVLDKKTGLTWQQVSPSDKRYNVAEASAYCAALTLAGARWRLPSVKELMSLVDLTVVPPAVGIDPTFPSNNISEAYWSSTPVFGMPSMGWWVTFVYGYPDRFDATDGESVRCVH